MINFKLDNRAKIWYTMGQSGTGLLFCRHSYPGANRMLFCNWCSREFVARREGSRFCSTACHDRYHIDERRKALAAWRAQQCVKRSASFLALHYNLALAIWIRTTGHGAEVLAMNNADEISQAEKRRILIEERRMRTYH